MRTYQAVPKLFAKKYGEGLLSRVVFKLPNGEEWPIRLSGSGDEIWFREGWRQFADFYSVTSMGYSLVFEYLGDSRFLVLIFDPSASEISYPPSNETTNPSFEVAVAPSHVLHGPRRLTSRVRIPNGFASSMEKDVCGVELWIEGTCWPVKLQRETQKGNEYINMAGGWRSFAVENSLKEGQVCVFQLIETKEDGNGISKTMKFNVNILRRRIA